MTQQIDSKTIINIIQWIISALAIPSLIWAWTLSSDVKVQQREIEDMKEDVSDIEKNSLQLATLNANLENLKEKMDEIKDILRE
jgi:Tfp pilus assembly protein PilO